MAFDPKQLWQLSILETAGIATVTASALLIAGVVYSIWQLPMVLWHKLYSGNRSHPGLSLCTAPFFDGGVYSHRIALG